MGFELCFECVKGFESDPDFHAIYQEFISYKTNSGKSEHSRPTNKLQQSRPSLSPLLGRDRQFIDPSLSETRETLTHLHVYQDTEDCVDWFDNSLPDTNKRTAGILHQWYCTSDSYFIYSYFVHEGKRYYYVIDYITDDAHSFLDDPDARKLWTDTASNFRKSIVGK